MLQAVLLLLCANVAAGQLSPPPSSPPPPAEAAPIVTFAPAPAPSSPSSIVNEGNCDFIYTSPRFYRVVADVTLQGARYGEELLNDAFIRLLTEQLDLSGCQVSLSSGTNCTSGTQQLPCSNPVYNCGDGVVISEDVYEAASGGACDKDTSNNTLVCYTIASNPKINTAVAAGSCRPACISGSGSQATQEFPVYCSSYLLTLQTPDLQSAVALADALGNNTVQRTISDGLQSFASGPGLQFLVVSSSVEPVVGFGFFPPPPPPLRPIEPAPNATDANNSTETMGEAAEIVFGPWSACSPACGEGISTRVASCYAADGTLLPLLSCPGGAEAAAQTSQSCSTECAEAYFQYSPWTTCSAACGGGNTTREATCVSPSGAQCTEAPEPTSMACNTAPCTSLAWNAAAWGECSAPCGGGTRSRTVSCVDATGAAVADPSACLGTKPAETEQCNRQACDFCADNACLGRGTCAAGVCTCNAGYSGAYCETPDSCTAGAVDAKLACCGSGVVDVAGACCPQGSSLDAAGQCCAGGKVDACGVCGGAGLFLDMQGTCCPAADANGVCCPSGMVDECGVCDGVGNSCAVVMVAQLAVSPTLIQGNGVLQEPIDAVFKSAVQGLGLPPEAISSTNVSMGTPAVEESSSRRRLAQTAGEALLPPPPPPSSPQENPAGFTLPLEVTVAVEPSSNFTSTSPWNAAYLSANLQSAADAATATSASVALTAPMTLERRGVCGNGICEIGERSTLGVVNGTCPQDCGLSAVACPGGCGAGGNCLPAAGVCECHAGYAGPNCADCAFGFLKASAACLTSVAALDIVDPSVVGPSGEALVTGEPPEGSSSSAGGVSVGVIVGAAVGGVMLLALAVALCCCCWKRRREGRAGGGHTYHGSPKMDYDAPHGTAAGYVHGPRGDVEVGLRQLHDTMGGRGGHSLNGEGPYNVHVDVSGGAAAAPPPPAPAATTFATRNNAVRMYQNAAAAGAPPMIHVIQETAVGEVGLRQMYGTVRPKDAAAPLGLRQLYGNMAAAGGASDSERAPSEGWNFARDSARSMAEQSNSQSSSRRPLGPSLDAAARRNTFELPAEAELHRSRTSSAYGSSTVSDVSDSSGATASAGAAVTVSTDSFHPLQSQRSSTAADPGSRLFFNPAYSMDGRAKDLSASVAPAYVKQLAKEPQQAKVAAAETILERRARLDALRAAIKSLEQQQSTKGPPAEAAVKDFLPGRPGVPKLDMGVVQNAAARRQRAATLGPTPAAVGVLPRQNSLPQGELIKAHGASSSARGSGNGYNDVMAKVEGALLQRGTFSAGTSPGKKFKQPAMESRQAPRVSHFQPQQQQTWR